MKILIATGLFPPEVGGPATYSKILSEELPKRGIEVSVLPFKIVRHLPRIFRHGAYFLSILQSVRGVDIIYAQDPVSVGLPAVLAAKIFGKRFFLKVVGDYAWEQEELLAMSYELLERKQFIDPMEFQTRRFGFVTEVRRKIEHFVARQAETVIVPSEYLKKIVKQWGVAEQKIFIVPNAFEIPNLVISKVEARTRLNISGTVIVGAGRLVPWKGFAALIESFVEVKKVVPDARLYIAGDGPLGGKLAKDITKFSLTDAVILLGDISKEKLFLYIRAADCFVLNTGYEGLSHGLLEVMALKTPIITTLAGGNRELFGDGRYAEIVEYNDKDSLTEAILRLSNDKERGMSLADKAYERVQYFSKERSIQGLTELL